MKSHKVSLNRSNFKNRTSAPPLRCSPHGDSRMKEKSSKPLTSRQEHTGTTLSSHNHADEVKSPLTAVIHDHVPLELTPHQWNQSVGGRLCHTPEKSQISVGIWPPRLYDFSLSVTHIFHLSSYGFFCTPKQECGPIIGQTFDTKDLANYTAQKIKGSSKITHSRSEWMKYSD